MSLKPENITAVVLAGGRGQRLGGRDKGLVEFRQCPIVGHVIEAVAPQVAGILINANRSKEAYSNFGYPVVSDDFPDFQGPLAGFAAAMKQATTSHILVLPCDGPFVSADFVQRMIDGLVAEGAEIAVAHDGNRLQPVHALIRTDLLKSLDQFLESGERKIDLWYGLHRVALVDFSDSPAIFQNINTQEELQRLERAPDD